MNWLRQALFLLIMILIEIGQPRNKNFYLAKNIVLSPLSSYNFLLLFWIALYRCLLMAIRLVAPLFGFCATIALSGSYLYFCCLFYAFYVLIFFLCALLCVDVRDCIHTAHPQTWHPMVTFFIRNILFFGKISSACILFRRFFLYAILWSRIKRWTKRERNKEESDSNVKIKQEFIPARVRDIALSMHKRLCIAEKYTHECTHTVMRMRNISN